MATIQARKSRGHTYWYIVESRRVNGKPRPITLAYLGKASDLLERLSGQKDFMIRSYSHGDTRALLQIAEELQVIEAINGSVAVGSSGGKPIRDGLTVGGSLLLAAIGRACHPTSKRGWSEWAKGTALDYVLKIRPEKLTSQHFWDQMDALPAKAIAEVEERLVRSVVETYGIEMDLLLLDTTNFFTFIDSSNGRSELAQRGKNKQKRMDLRQVGLACLVSRKEQLPLFHYTFRGNKPDVTIFKEILNRLNERLAVLTDVERVTLVFDKGNNSKKNLSDLKQTGLHYVGSLTPAYHKKLLQQANQHWQVVKIKNKDISVYRTREEIWGETRTIIVYISERLRQGQIRGIRQIVAKKFKTLEQLQNGLQKRNKKSTRQQIRSRIEKVLQGQYIAQVVVWNLQKRSGNWDLSYRLDEDKLRELSESYLGRRILMTNRHDWNAEEIILAYWSQSHVECAFRRMKNPYHGAFRPQFHWTDQKIQVHAFLCVLAYLLTMVAFLKAKQNGYAGSVATLMEQLRSIRLAALIEQKHGQRGKMKINYRLEEIPEELVKVVDALKIASSNLRSTINVGVYT